MAVKMEKCTKNVITLTLVILFFGYIYLSWLKLDKGQVALAKTQKHVRTIVFPKLAICAKVSNWTKTYKHYEEGGSIVVKANLPLEYVGKKSHETRWDFKTTRYKYFGQHTICDEMVYGDNQQLHLEVGNSHGVMVLLDKDTLETVGHLLVMVMDQEEDFIIKSFTEDIHIIDLKGYKMANGSGTVVSTKLVSLKVNILTTIDRDDQPCYKENPKNQTLHGCIWNEILHSHQCTVLTGTDVQHCESEEEITDFYKSLIAITAMSPKEVYQTTESKCKPNCRQTSYKMTVGEAVYNAVTEEHKITMYNTSDYTDEFYFYFPSPLVTVSNEFEVYDFLDWAADCGGMGGILLGLSVAAGYKWLAKMCKKVTQNKNKKFQYCCRFSRVKFLPRTSKQ